MATRGRDRHFLWPIVLIAIGLVLLLQNFGLADWSLWQVLGRYWPAILILIGLDLLLARSNPWLAGAIAAAAVLALFVAAWYTAASLPNTAAQDVPSQHVVQELPDRQRYEVHVQFGAGTLALGALDATSNNLMEGDALSDTGRGITSDMRCDGDNCVLRINGDRGRGWSFAPSSPSEKWDIKLSPRAQLDLRVESGASRLDVDLTSLQIRELRLDAGASNGTLKLPTPTGTVPVTVRAGAANLTVEVPSGAAARIRSNVALGSILIDQSRFGLHRDDGANESADFETATNRLDVNIEAGASSVRVR